MKKRKEKMKTKNRLMAAIVLCALFLVTLAGIGIVSATEDETLDVYGNANEDDIIDMRDLTFTARMILRLEDETELADANYDGRVSVADMTQIGLIILGRESKLTFVDSADRIVTVNKPVESIISGLPETAEVVKILGAWDRAVGRDYYTTEEMFPFFPGASELPVVTGPVSLYDVDFEKVFELDPDIFLTYYAPYPELEEVIATFEPEIPVVTLNFDDPTTMAENIRKLRYVLNTEEKGEEYIAWYEGVINSITEKTTGLSEDKKPRIFFWFFSWDYQDQYMTLAGDYSAVQSQLEIVGGTNIAEDLTGWFPYVNEEWLMGEDIDVILCWASSAIVPAFGYSTDDTTVAQETRDWIMDADENPALAASDAVKDGKVYLHEHMALSPRVVVTLVSCQPYNVVSYIMYVLHN
nr:ABC transporter, solute-binding protein [uncultured archaeon]